MSSRGGKFCMTHFPKPQGGVTRQIILPRARTFWLLCKSISTARYETDKYPTSWQLSPTMPSSRNMGKLYIKYKYSNVFSDSTQDLWPIPAITPFTFPAFTAWWQCLWDELGNMNGVPCHPWQHLALELLFPSLKENKDIAFMLKGAVRKLPVPSLFVHTYSRDYSWALAVGFQVKGLNSFLMQTGLAVLMSLEAVLAELLVELSSYESYILREYFYLSPTCTVILNGKLGKNNFLQCTF